MSSLNIGSAFPHIHRHASDDMGIYSSVLSLSLALALSLSHPPPLSQTLSIYLALSLSLSIPLYLSPILYTHTYYICHYFSVMY